MYKKTIKYVDYNGQEHEEDFYFNLSRAEIMDMELSAEGGLAEKIKKIVKVQNVKEIVDIFKTIIAKSYGVKSDDGKRFIKNKDLVDSFVQTEAYSNLFIELASNADAASEFINGIMPQLTDDEKAKMEQLKQENK